MRTIPLHGKLAAGRVALVDDEDYEQVNQYRWVVFQERRPSGTLQGPYAVTYLWLDRRSVGIRMHKMLTGWPITDHINHDGLDNRRANLRAATVSQNVQNARKRTGSISPYKGVMYERGGRRQKRWFAEIRVNGRARRLGYFLSEEEAARVYDAAAKEAFGEFACVNFPDQPDLLAPLRPPDPGEEEGPREQAEEQAREHGRAHHEW